MVLAMATAKATAINNTTAASSIASTIASNKTAAAAAAAMRRISLDHTRHETSSAVEGKMAAQGWCIGEACIVAIPC